MFTKKMIQRDFGASGMNFLGVITFFLFFLLPGSMPESVSASDNPVPSEINGFRLGAPIDDYDFIKHRNYLNEVVIDEIGGFRRGFLSYGTCERPGEIVRIKLKYKDTDYRFYEQLLKRYKERFGKPDKFTGDAFGIVLSWKWRFKDKDGNTVTMTLQHNKKDHTETVGNMVKLAMPDRIEAERKCFIKACEKDKIACPVSMMKEDWDNFIPK